MNEPLDEDLALARAEMRAHPPVLDAQRRARLWKGIDGATQRRARPFPWFAFAGLGFAAATASVFFLIGRPVDAPEDPKAPKAPKVATPIVSRDPLPAPSVKASHRIRGADVRAMTIEGAELTLAEGAELELSESGVIELKEGSIEASVHAIEPVVFACGDARVSALSARFRLSKVGGKSKLEVFDGVVDDGSESEPHGIVPVQAATNEHRMAMADAARLSGMTDRAIRTYEDVVRDPHAGVLREEAMLREAVLYAESDRATEALRVLAVADAKIKGGLLLPERIALAVELLVKEGRMEEARAKLTRADGIASPALERARAMVDEP